MPSGHFGLGVPSGHFRLGVPSGHGAERARRIVRIRSTAQRPLTSSPNGPTSTGSPNGP